MLFADMAKCANKPAFQETVIALQKPGIGLAATQPPDRQQSIESAESVTTPDADRRDQAFASYQAMPIGSTASNCHHAPIRGMGTTSGSSDRELAWHSLKRSLLRRELRCAVI
jgi:hypothetical protein